MIPKDFEKSTLLQSKQMFIEASHASTCRPRGPDGEMIERTYDFVIASRSLRRKITKMEVVEDFESRPHKASLFVAERDKEIQEWREQQILEASPGFSGGRLPGRSKAEKGRAEEARKTTEK